ncbi:NAD-dependent epimerase/dehydratase family protein [Mangrovimonas sp. DI 80]|uniref:NAD-dependent epimerase/dehydratase family protein n=1 Tax=Mangrovimonas sp. DI 80 TaxID=1779330 RepID=UPI000975B9D8|nr:NAD-dependent epimerase/dehydratase family protein [Mangrovimonas sp. DI 80]OMP32610.1 NAD-dependent epimerase [Mangrovimonas sp. DI 80]
MVLVTGGTGLVGSHLLYKLISNNEKVRAIYRNPESLSSVKKVFSYYSQDSEKLFGTIKWVKADITDIPSLEIVFQGITQVYHCAALVSFAPNDYYKLRKINIEGTANVVNLCLANGIAKLCYVSSIATVGKPPKPEMLIDETTPWNPEDDNSVYSITKYGAEMEVWRGSQEGLNIVMVNPGVIIGPGFWNGNGSSGLIRRIHKGIPYYTTGTGGYVDVDDVVNIMHQLMHSEITNENFILVSANLPFKDFQYKIATALDVSPAKKELPQLFLEMGWRLDWFRHKLTGANRQLSKQMAKTVRNTSFYDSSKVKNTLNYTFKDIDTSIEGVCQYFLEDL